MKLEGARALVTGGGKRLGQAFAEGLVDRGAEVVVHYHTSRKGAESVGAKAVLEADLSDPDSAAGLIPRAFEALGGLEIVVNNASVFEPGELMETTFESWSRHLAVNLSAPYAISQAFAGKASRGAIVNILDWRALKPGADYFAYTVSKAGLAAMTRSLAVALAPSIRVNGLALGAILPPEGSRITDEILRRIPLGRRGEVREAVEALVFLLSGPEFLTGEIVHLDGGRQLT
jgi:pteridine reductase